MSSREGGFATVAVIGICAALATVVATLLQFTQAQRDRVIEEIEREQQEQALQSAIAQEVAELATAPRQLPDTVRRTVSDWTIEIQIANEQAKVNVLTADAALIAAAFEPLGVGGASGVAQRLVEMRDEQVATKTSPLSDILLGAGVPANGLDCAQEALTVYGSSLDPLATGNPGSMDGGVLNLRARIVLPQPSDILRERVFVVTGDSEAPLLELSDRRLRLSLIERCPHEES